MGLLQGLVFSLWDAKGTVLGHVKDWKPKKCSTEKDYEKSLGEYLRARLEGISVVAQYGAGRVRADIVVGDKVCIELKHHLDSTSKLQRLKGQIDDYRTAGKPLIVVVTGETDPELKRDLKKFVDKNSASWGDGFEMDVVFK